MIKCGICASHLQALATLSRFETLLTFDNVAIFIPRDKDGMLVSYSVEVIDGKIRLVAPIEYDINLKNLTNCNVICEEQRTDENRF